MTLIKKDISLLIITTVFLITLLFLITSNSLANNSITFEKAIELALENNSEIKDLRYNINNLQRNKEIIFANKDWNLSLSGSYTHDFEETENSITNGGNINSGDSSENSITLRGSKNFDFALALNPSITILEEDEYLSLSVTQKLFPLQKSEYEKNLYTVNKDIEIAEENLKSIKANKIITWTQNYLNIVRMEENKEIYKESVKKAENNLEKVKEEMDIGEAGESQLITAQISLENARYNLKEQEYKIEENKSDFKNKLGIKQDKKIIFDDKDSFIINLEEKAEELTNEYLKTDDLMSIVKKNNIDLITNKMERDDLERELADLKGENKVNVDITGSYNTLSENGSATLNFEYNLFDGGKNELNIESQKESIEKNKENYNEKYKELELELKKILHNLALNKDKLKREKLNYEKSLNDLEVAKKQYDNGVIDYLNYQESWIASNESEIALKSLKDSNFITKLNFINFINCENVIGGF